MERLDLEEYKVASISRESAQLTIELENSTNGKLAAVYASGKIIEEAEYYTGHNIQGKHSDPSFPLDLIEVAELDEEMLELQGYLKNEPWYVWRIKADKFDIRIS